MKPACIVVADDLGITHARNRGIIEALQNGTVTATSIMANGMAADSALTELRERGMLDRVGLHLNLTEGQALLPRETVPTLVLEAGTTQAGTGLTTGALFLGKQGFWDACVAGHVNAEEVAAEARAQIKWFTERVGRPPARVDGHQHCHVVSHAVARALAAVFAETGVESTRIPAERCPDGILCPRCADARKAARMAVPAYARAGISWAEEFVGLSLCGGHYNTERFVQAVEAAVAKGRRSCEVMVHPGYANLADEEGDSWDDFDRSTGRSTELSVLCDKEVRERLEACVDLVSQVPLLTAGVSIEGGSASSVLVRSGKQKLQLLVPDGVHLDPADMSLNGHICDGVAIRPGDAVLEFACGTGILGLLALRAGAKMVRFTDISSEAVRSASINAPAAGYAEGTAWSAGAFDLNSATKEALGGEASAFTVLLCNPPQLPGPPELEVHRATRYGGHDGLNYYRCLLRHAEALLREGGRILFMQTSFSGFPTLDAYFKRAGFLVETLAVQTRTASSKAIAVLADGTYEWLLDMRRREIASFEVISGTAGNDDAIKFQQRLALATRGPMRPESTAALMRHTNMAASPVLGPAVLGRA